MPESLITPAMSRRRLLSLSAGALLMNAFAVPLALADSREAPTAWSQAAQKAAAPVLAACCRHPFVAGLADGTLPKEAFLFYCVQNVHYLKGYAGSLSALAERLEHWAAWKDAAAREAAVRQLRAWAADTDAVRESLSGVYAEHAGGRSLQDDPLFKEAEPATLLYISYEAFAARSRHPGASMAALLPCFWIYEGLGSVFTQQAKSPAAGRNPYASWIGGYGSPEYSLEVRRAFDIAERLGGLADEKTRSEMTEVFVMACRMELHLLEAAMRRMRWEPL